MTSVVSEDAIPFDDGKAPDALRTIGEVADALGIRQHVLRYWEEQFPMLRPLKRNGGRRYYRPEDVRLVRTIDRLVHKQGFTLRGARLALEGKGAEVPPPPAPAAVGTRGDDRLAKLAAIRDRLARALAAA
ncbi:MerR family transcriptional regulator [Parablastomonas sp. CN1-191]|uniref:MerR family transcriptional regulator n=1 Tax=Parablastomonas sp. CN1-191 TaxID=3400908 RepID=UPI003BF7FAE8